MTNWPSRGPDLNPMDFSRGDILNQQEATNWPPRRPDLTTMDFSL